MKLVKKQDFLKLPPGTVFVPYQPVGWVMNGLFIKEESCNVFSETPDSTDFFQIAISEPCGKGIDPPEFFMRLEAGEDVPLDFDCCGREGLFDDSSLYAVFSPKDVEGLIKVLQSTLQPNKEV